MGETVMGWRLMQRIVVTIVFLSFSGAMFAAEGAENQTIAAFNDRFTHAIRTMNNAETVALWDDEGVSLLPNMKPIQGKAAIKQFMDGITSKMSGYRVISHDSEFRDTQVSADWASEWAITTQVVQPPDGKPQFTIYGKMLLVLHRAKDGAWKIKEESWTSSPTP